MKADDKEMARIVGRCVEFGEGVLVEDVSEDVDSVLNVLLLRGSAGEGNTIRFNDR